MEKATLKRAYFILARNRWKTPRMGTDSQHRALVKLARELRYTSVQQFLHAWPSYPRIHAYHTEDGSLSKVEAHWLFLHLRKVKRSLIKRMIPDD